MSIIVYQNIMSIIRQSPFIETCLSGISLLHSALSQDPFQSNHSSLKLHSVPKVVFRREISCPVTCGPHAQQLLHNFACLFIFSQSENNFVEQDVNMKV